MALTVRTCERAAHDPDGIVTMRWGNDSMLVNVCVKCVCTICEPWDPRKRKEKEAPRYEKR